MKRKRILLALLLLTLAGLACNAPGAGPTSAPPATVTPYVPPPEETVPSATEPPEEPTATSEPEGPTETVPAPTTTITPTVTAAPTSEPTVASSEGPLDFSIPSSLDNYQPTGEGDYEVTLVIHITGGAPPFTVHHDVETFETNQRDYPIVFRHRGCSAIVHTINVESADGQTATHDYYIPVPWCN